MAATLTPTSILQERPGANQARGVYVTLEELVGLGNGQAELRLDSRQRSLAALAGRHRSNFRGRGVDFDEVRIYNPGDDIRSIDWRVTARTGKAHTKVFREERERPVYVMVDQRQSMFFGSRVAFKSVVAARGAAMLAWAAREHGDRLGAFLFNDSATQELRPTDGTRGLQAFFRHLVHFNQKLDADTPIPLTHRQAIEDALLGLARVVKPGSLVFMLSDFSQMDDIALQQLSLVRRHSDIIAFAIHDPLERQLPPAGTYGFTDGRRTLMADTSDKKVRKQYSMRHLETQARLRTRLSGMAVPLIDLSTEDDIASVLEKTLGMRGKNRKRP
jgi:uncharacterized protein (DUF58 family)